MYVLGHILHNTLWKFCLWGEQQKCREQVNTAWNMCWKVQSSLIKFATNIVTAANQPQSNEIHGDYSTIQNS